MRDYCKRLIKAAVAIFCVIGVNLLTIPCHITSFISMLPNGNDNSNTNLLLTGMEILAFAGTPYLINRFLIKKFTGKFIDDSIAKMWHIIIGIIFIADTIMLTSWIWVVVG